MTKTKNMGFRGKKKKGEKWSIPDVKMYTVGSKLIGVLRVLSFMHLMTQFQFQLLKS